MKENKELQIGTKVESEHLPTYEFIRDYFEETGIAKDHLKEMPDYYSRLERMESEAKEEGDGDIIKAHLLPDLLKSHILITDLQKSIIEEEYNDIQKAKWDFSKLQKKTIVNIDGKKQVVWIRIKKDEKKEKPIGNIGDAMAKLEKKIEINNMLLNKKNEKADKFYTDVYNRTKQENLKLEEILNKLKSQQQKLDLKKHTKRVVDEIKGEEMFDKIKDAQQIVKTPEGTGKEAQGKVDKEFWWQLDKLQKLEYLALTRKKDVGEIKKFKERVLGTGKPEKSEEKVAKPAKTMTKEQADKIVNVTQFTQEELLKKRPKFITDEGLWARAIQTATDNGEKTTSFGAAVQIYKNKEKMIIPPEVINKVNKEKKSVKESENKTEPTRDQFKEGSQIKTKDGKEGEIMGVSYAAKDPKLTSYWIKTKEGKKFSEVHGNLEKVREKSIKIVETKEEKLKGITKSDLYKKWFYIGDNYVRYDGNQKDGGYVFVEPGSNKETIIKEKDLPDKVIASDVYLAHKNKKENIVFEKFKDDFNKELKTLGSPPEGVQFEGLVFDKVGQEYHVELWSSRKFRHPEEYVGEGFDKKRQAMEDWYNGVDNIIEKYEKKYNVRIDTYSM